LASAYLVFLDAPSIKKIQEIGPISAGSSPQNHKGILLTLLLSPANGGEGGVRGKDKKANSYTIEPFAKVSEKHIEKAFPEELESVSCWVFDLSSFGSHLKDGFLSAGHIDLPLSTFFFAV